MRRPAFVIALLTSALQLRAQSPDPTAPDLAHCPDWGSAAKGSDHGLLNVTKHQRPPANATPTRIDFEDMLTLQMRAEDLGIPMGRGTDLKPAQRQQLHGLAAGGHTIGEGDFVQLEAYVADEKKNPRFNGGESVYCYLREHENNDIHINIVSDPEDDEFDGIVAEMMPYNRLKSWDLPKLRLVRQAGRKVMLRGSLFFDNVHIKRTGCDVVMKNGKKICWEKSLQNAGGNPARASLWEIHPVTEFRVCMRPTNSCSTSNAAQWLPLQKVSDAKLKALIKP